MRGRWQALPVVVLCVGLVAGCGAGSDQSPPEEREESVAAPSVGPATVVRVDASSGEVRSVVPVGPDPLFLVAAAGQVWTLNLGDGTLSRVDPASGEVSPVRLGGEAVGIASDGSDVWAALDGNAIIRLEGATGRQKSTVRVAERPLFELRNAGFLAVGEGSVWLTVPVLEDPRAPHELLRIDPETGEAFGSYPLLRDVLPPLAEGGYVWVPSPPDDAVSRIDARSGEVANIPLGVAPGPAAAGAGSIWFGHFGQEEIWRVDPTSGEVTARIPAGDQIRGVAFGGGALWATTETSLLEVDPGRNQIVDRIQLTERVIDAGPTGVAYLDGSVWISVE